MNHPISYHSAAFEHLPTSQSVYPGLGLTINVFITLEVMQDLFLLTTAGFVPNRKSKVSDKNKIKIYSSEKNVFTRNI